MLVSTTLLVTTHCARLPSNSPRRRRDYSHRSLPIRCKSLSARWTLHPLEADTANLRRVKSPFPHCGQTRIKGRVNFLEIDLPRPWHWFAFVFREFDGYDVEAGVKQRRGLEAASCFFIASLPTLALCRRLTRCCRTTRHTPPFTTTGEDNT